MSRLTYSKATLAAMREEMRRDDTVFLMGEDIAKQGGIFGQFKGLPEEFGYDRVRDFPISEAVLVSSAVGAAMTGSRPVIDIHFSDFLGCAMDELLNQAAKARFMFGGQAQVPMVVRAPEGAVKSAAAHHSQCLEAFFVHTPGWRVVSPATPQDAKGLLKTAIRSNDPVLFLEHKALYTQRGEVDDDPDLLVPLGQGVVRRPGTDVTVVSWSRTALLCQDAAATLAEEGIDAEVIDLRSLSPWDAELVVDSVTRTGRLLVAHEAPRTAGLGAEIAATVAERAFPHLRAPIARVANPDLPIPFAQPLEAAVIPDTNRITAAVRSLLS